MLYRTRYHQSLSGHPSGTSKSGKVVNTHRKTTNTDFLSENDSHTALDRKKFPFDEAIGMNVVAVADRSAESRNPPEHDEGIMVTTDVSQESFNVARLEDQPQ